MKTIDPYWLNRGKGFMVYLAWVQTHWTDMDTKQYTTPLHIKF